jgi:lipoprotein-anchoring transpeptidase ErfK/SrfK
LTGHRDLVFGASLLAEGRQALSWSSDGTLKLWDEQDQLIGQFTATLGSSTFPLPIGTWEVNGTAFNPDWGFDPDLIAGTAADAKAAVVPPGPNNPVGTAWIGLSKPGYGIHGTPHPEDIGKTASHGCFRLANWNAERLARMVEIGTPVEVVLE